jgi:hypothetical protein
MSAVLASASAHLMTKQTKAACKPISGLQAACIKTLLLQSHQRRIATCRCRVGTAADFV